MKWFISIRYNSNRSWKFLRTKASLLNILGFLASLPLGSWRDIEHIKIERLH